MRKPDITTRRTVGFTSVDPLTASANMKDPQTFNRYSYAINSPYKFTDPLGLIAVSQSCINNCPSLENEPPSGTQSAADVTPTVKIATEHNGVLEDGTKVTFTLPSETQDGLQSAAVNAEQTTFAQTQNSKAAVSQLTVEYAHQFTYKNPKVASTIGVVGTPDFKAANGTIIPFTPLDVGLDISIGPVTPTNKGLDSGYSAGTMSLVDAANSQLQDLRRQKDFMTSENFAAGEIKARGENELLPVQFKVVGSNLVQNGAVTKATLTNLHQKAVDLGIKTAEQRMSKPTQ